ncbi:MAG: ABC transporter permease [Thermomicrobiales bacterium]
MHQRFRTSWTIWAAGLLLAAILAALIVYPLGALISQAFDRGGEGPVRRMLDIAGDRSFLLSLRHSVEVAVGSSLLAGAIGLGLAWLTSRTDIPGRRWIEAGAMVPYLIPPFILAIAWVQLLGPVGYGNRFWMELTGNRDPLIRLYSAGGIIFVLGVSHAPLVYITLARALDRYSNVLEEAARAHGAGPFRTWWSVFLPTVGPSLAGGTLLALVAGLADFGVPAILGFSSGYFVLTTLIWEELNRFGSGDNLSRAAVLSLYLILLSVVFLWIGQLIQRRWRWSPPPGDAARIALGRWRGPVFGLILAWLVLTSVAPLIAVTLTALTPAWGIDPWPSTWTLDNFGEVFDIESVRRAARNSLTAAAVGATLASLVGVAVGRVLARPGRRGRVLLDGLVNAPYAVPGTVLAIGMILAYARPLPLLGSPLYNTLGIIIVAYVARYLALAARNAEVAFLRVDASLEEAARVAGANQAHVARDVLWPLIFPSLIAGWLLAFQPMLRELTLSLLLWSPGNETIGVVVFQLQDNGEVTGAAALAALLLIGIFAVQALTVWLTARADRARTASGPTPAAADAAARSTAGLPGRQAEA